MPICVDPSRSGLKKSIGIPVSNSGQMPCRFEKTLQT